MKKTVQQNLIARLEQLQVSPHLVTFRQWRLQRIRHRIEQVWGTK